jgi:hypothetical protein
MYVNIKMIIVETVSGNRGRGMKESSGGSEFKYGIVTGQSRVLAFTAQRTSS